MKPATNNPHSVDMQALMNALPTSGLEPQWLASIKGLLKVPDNHRWREEVLFLEPPADQRVPYIEPTQALEKLLRRQGVWPEDPQTLARNAVARMKKDITQKRWVNFFNIHEPDSPECLPVPDLVAWLRDERHRINRLLATLSPDAQDFSALASRTLLVSPDIIDFFEQAAEVATSTPIFFGIEHRNELWSLETLPILPQPEAMIEFMPSAPWADIDAWGDWKISDNPFLRWREAIRPIALELEKVLGEPVYHFADLSSDIDDDDVHRFLVLHWCCTWKPESAFVRYLLRVSGANNVEELKVALIDPTHYTQRFKMNDSFCQEDALTCSIDYLPPQTHKTVAVVFCTPQARNVAQWLLAQKIGVHALVVAPKELATADWLKIATRYCQGWEVHWMYDDYIKPIETLALVDELCVIANETIRNSGHELKLPEAVEELLWLALDLGIHTTCLGVDRLRVSNLRPHLKKCGVPARVAAWQAQRVAFTRQLKEIRLDNDFYSSGLWNEQGNMLGYDQLDVPFVLVRRIAAWQRDYDNTINPPDMGDDAWWERHHQEELQLARALQRAVGKGIAVKLYQQNGWLNIDEIDRIGASHT